MSILNQSMLRVPPEMIILEMLSFSVFSSFNANYGPVTLKRNTYKRRQKKQEYFRLFAYYQRLESQEDVSQGRERHLLTQTDARHNVPLCHRQQNWSKMWPPGPPPQHIFLIITLICLIGLLPFRAPSPMKPRVTGQGYKSSSG